MAVWVFQDPKQVSKHGAEAAAWSVGWYDPEGNRRCKACGPGTVGKRNAEKVAKKIEAELLTGTYQSNEKKTWADFRQEYQTRVMDGRNREDDAARTGPVRKARRSQTDRRCQLADDGRFHIETTV
jgi:hypothetical protein